MRVLTFGVLSQGISGPGEKIMLGYDGLAFCALCMNISHE